jgi:osmotically-inducible protein OsmY
MRRIARWFHYALGATVGAAAAYLFDPERGRSRRARLKDQATAVARRGKDKLTTDARYAAGQAKGAAATRAGFGEPRPVDDRSVADLVHQAVTELPFDTSAVTVEVVDRWVTLRGQLTSPEQMQQVVDAARATAGVQDVGSYLHLPGEPAPNKAQALRAS